MGSKNKKKTDNSKNAPKGFATDRVRLKKASRVMALLLAVVMVVFMLLSSSIYLFN